MTSRDAGFADLQRRFFERADPAQFHWLTRAAGLADTEDALLAPFRDGLAPPCLEIGCGEGANLFRLQQRGWCVGVDRSIPKVAFAASHVAGGSFAASDAATLPFRDGAFRSVFIRDLLHHVTAPEHVLAEVVRVLVPGGRLALLEPNGQNPMIRALALLVPAEVGAGRSGTGALLSLLEGLPLAHVEATTLQPLALRRFVLHHRFGLPALGRVPATRRALAAIERLLGRLLPPARWTYVAVTAERAPARA